MPLSQIRLTKKGYVTAETGFLLALALVCGTAGARYTFQIGGPWPPPEVSGALILIENFLPLRVWGAWWLLAGAMCLASALAPRPWCVRFARRWPWFAYLDGAGAALSYGVTLAWGITYLIWWVVGVVPGPYGNTDSWRTAALWLGFAGMIWFALIASKPRRKQPRGGHA